MPVGPVSGIVVGRGASRRWRLLALLPLLLLLLAAVMSPASASAQPSTCLAEVTATQDPEVAAFSVSCDPENIVRAEVESSESGSIEENSGTDCSPEGEGRAFTCEPTSSSTLVSARFRAADGDVCDDPRLELTFSADTETGSEDVGTSEISGCSDASGSGEEGSGDEGDVPEGGIDTGLGGTDDGGSAAAPVLAIGGLGLGALVLVGGGLALRRRSAR